MSRLARTSARAVVATLTLVAAAGALGPTARAVTPPLAVHAVGNHLVDQYGHVVRLLGVDRSGAEFACAQGWGLFDGPATAASVTAMAAWHIDAVRLPLNEDCWLGINGVKSAYGGAAYRSAIKSYVATLHAAHLLVILDLHWNAPGRTLALGQQVMPDADHSPAFWSSVASTFKSDPAVVFDAYNEPHDVSWSCWRSGCTTSAGWRAAGMQSLVTAIRATGARQPIMLGGLGWSSDLSGWLHYLPYDPVHQLLASFHVYNFSGCHTTTCWNTYVTPVAQKVPVVTGEIGENDCRASFIDGFMTWADGHGLSYLGWTWNTWSCTGGPALITSYSGTPTAFGLGLKEHLAALRV